MIQTTDTDKLRSTVLQRKREKRNHAMVKEYERLAADPKNSRVAIVDYLKTKHGFYSRASVYSILKKYRNEEV